MKTWITVLCAVALLAGCAKEKKDPEVEDQKPAVEASKVVVDRDQLEYRDGLRYFEEKPFTGVAVSKYKNGQKHGEITYKGGKLYGLWTSWGENGQKWVELTYKDSKKDGPWVGYWDNGQLKSKGTYKDGKGHGPWVSYLPDGSEVVGDD